MVKAHSRPRIAAVAVLCVGVLAAGCSSADRATDFTVAKDQPLVISLDDLLANTGGSAAVATADPAHGTLSRRTDGALVYTPDAGYTGADSIEVTTTDAVRLYTTDIPPIGELGGTTVQGSGFGSAWTPVPGSTDEFYGLTDRGPNVDGPGKNEKIAPTPTFVPKIGRFQLVGNRAVLRSVIELHTAAGVPFNGQVDVSASTGETIKDLAGNVLPPPTTVSTRRGSSRCRTARSGFPTNTGRFWCISTPRASSSNDSSRDEVCRKNFRCARRTRAWRA